MNPLKAFDVVDNSISIFAITFGIVMAVLWHFDIIINAQMARAMENPYQLAHAVVFSTIDEKPFYRYVEKAIQTGDEVVDGVNVTEYLQDLGLNSTCWRITNATGYPITGNCRGYSRKIKVPLVNGSLEMWYR